MTKETVDKYIKRVVSDSTGKETFVVGAKKVIYGQEQTFNATFNTLTKAQNARDNWFQSLKEDMATERSWSIRVTANSSFVDYLRHIVDEQKSIEQQRTASARESVFNWAKRSFGNRTINQMTSKIIFDSLPSNFKTPGGSTAKHTQEKRLSTLKIAFEKLMLDGVINQNPLINQTTGKPIKITTFDEKEPQNISLNKSDSKTLYNHLLNKINSFTESWQTYPLIAFVGLSTGMRPAEVTALTWDKLDEQSKTLTIDRSLDKDGSFKKTKTSTTRTIEITDDLFDILKKYKHHQIQWLKKYGWTTKIGFMFLSEDLMIRTDGLKESPVMGKDGARMSFNIWLRGELDKLNIHPLDTKGKPISVSFYNLRHTYATMSFNMMKAETYAEEAKALADHMGHSVEQLLKTYVNSTPESRTKFYTKQNTLYK